MNATCGSFRYGLDDDVGQPNDQDADGARERHLESCAACRDEVVNIAAQRATVRDAFGADAVAPALAEAIVRRCVAAMARAAAGEPPSPAPPAPSTPETPETPETTPAPPTPPTPPADR